MIRLTFITLVFAVVAGCGSQKGRPTPAGDAPAPAPATPLPASPDGGTDARQVFEKRIVPIFQSPNPPVACSATSRAWT